MYIYIVLNYVVSARACMVREGAPAARSELVFRGTTQTIKKQHATHAPPQKKKHLLPPSLPLSRACANTKNNNNKKNETEGSGRGAASETRQNRFFQLDDVQVSVRGDSLSNEQGLLFKKQASAVVAGWGETVRHQQHEVVYELTRDGGPYRPRRSGGQPRAGETDRKRRRGQGKEDQWLAFSQQ